MLIEASIGLTAGLAAAWGYPRAARWMRMRHDQPRESRQERRRRLVRSFVEHSLEASDQGLAADARYWARRAQRIEGAHPEVLAARGQAEYANGRYELALAYLDRAYSQAQETCLAGLLPGFGVQVGVTGAKACAQIRLHVTDPVQRDVLAERLLAWARIAAREDPESMEELEEWPALRELQEPVRRLHGMDPWMVER